MKRSIYTVLIAVVSLTMLYCAKSDEGGGTTPPPIPPNLVDPDFKNLAVGATVISSSHSVGAGPEFLVDGIIEAPVNTKVFQSAVANNNHTEWVRIEMTEKHLINEVWMVPNFHVDHGGFPVDFTIETSLDGTSWTNAVTVTEYPRPWSAVPQKFGFATVEAKFVRITVTRLFTTANEWTNYNDAYYIQLSEIELYKRDLAVSSVTLDSYIATQGKATKIDIEVVTEHAADNAEFTVELVKASDKTLLSSPVKGGGTLSGNRGSASITIPATVSEGQYMAKVIVSSEDKSGMLYSGILHVKDAGTNTYYVSASTGSDSNDGLSESKPFKTLTKVSRIELRPGESILLKRGDRWEGEGLYPQGSGTKELPVTIAPYGSGSVRPVISPGYPAPYEEENIYGIRVVNAAGYEIRGLEIEKTLGGIVFWAANTYNHKYILIEDCYIHDIHSQYSNFGQGWGHLINPPDLVTPSGICIYGSDNIGNSRVYEDIEIRNCELYLCDIGIQMIARDYDPAEKWEYHNKSKITSNAIHNVRIYNCNIKRSYRTGGVCLSCVDNVHAKDLLVDETGYLYGMFWGVCAFQMSRASNSLIEDCTFSNTIKRPNWPDGQGFDFESDCRNITLRNCRFINNDECGLLAYGGTWPGDNRDNVIDGCYFEGNNVTHDSRIFNIGKPENWGVVRNCTIKIRDRVNYFYSYPFVFEESNRVYNSQGELVYSGGPNRSSPLFSDDFNGDLSKWEESDRAVIKSGELSVNNGRSIYMKNSSGWTDYFVECEVTCLTEPSVPAVILRRNASTGDHYIARIALRQNNNSLIEISKSIDSRNTVLATYACPGMRKNVTNKVRFELSGSDIRVFVDGNQMFLNSSTSQNPVFSFTDSSLSSGEAGLSMGSSGEALFDNVLVCPL